MDRSPDEISRELAVAEAEFYAHGGTDEYLEELRTQVALEFRCSECSNSFLVPGTTCGPVFCTCGFPGDYVEMEFVRLVDHGG